MIQKMTFSLHALGGQSFKNSSICNWLQNLKIGRFPDYYNIVLDYPNVMPFNVHNFTYRTALSQWSFPLSLFAPSF